MEEIIGVDVGNGSNLDVKDEGKDFNDKSDELEENELVTWALPYDPENPKQWDPRRKWAITFAMGGMTLVVTFASSVFSTATRATAEEFHVSSEVTTLGTSLYILGFALGPIMWGPTSEFLGRWLPFFGAYIVFCICQIPVAVAQNLETVILFRFLSGLFGTAPLAVTAGVMADIWDPIDCGAGIAIFGLATFVGPAAAPVAGGFLTASSLGWRWTAWITLIMGSFFGLIGLTIIPETYAPLLLSRRASKLRHETQNWSLHSKFDEKRLNFNTIINTYLFLPIRMLFQETILFLVALYLSLVYAVLYLSLESLPISFSEERGWKGGVGSLPFLALLVGFFIGGGIILFQNYHGYAKLFHKNGSAPPEARLPPMMIGAIAFPIGLFWFGWTSSPHITWVPQVLSCVPIGTGIICIFMQGLNYIVDAYRVRANSAIAASTFLRGFIAAGFPMFATAMFHKLTVPWAMSLLGFLAVALIPVPFVFYYYGKTIRRTSRYCAG